MNQMSPFDMQDTGAEADAPRLSQQATAFKIMRSGAKPLNFEGIELCMAMSYVPGAPYWYEINLYRTTEQRFVAAVRIFFRSEDERDRARAWEVETFDAALDKLEAYDASEDIRVQMFADETQASPAELAAHGFSLMAKAQAAQHQYGGLLGEILYELENSA
ncbi:MAG: hypothetical protein ACFBRM_02045 [Pikeienuella sp.]